MSYPTETKATLVMQQTGQSFPLGQETVTIGRKAGNTIVLADDSAVSRHHAIVFWQAGNCMIQDVGSANGTYLNDQRLAEPQSLSDGDILRMGRTTFAVQLLPEEETAGTPPPEGATIVSTSLPPVEEPDRPTERISTPSPVIQPIENPYNQNLFFIEESEDTRGNYDIFDPESGQLFLQCVQARDLVKSILKVTGKRKAFDCWIRTPEEKAAIRITKGLGTLTAKPVAIHDEHDQVMGEFRQKDDSHALSFEVFDAAKIPVFRIELDGGDYKFLTGDMQFAYVSKKPSGSFQRIRSDQEGILLEISSSVPKTSFIRQLIVAATISMLLMVDSARWWRK